MSALKMQKVIADVIGELSPRLFVSSRLRHTNSIYARPTTLLRMRFRVHQSVLSRH
eukprot:IDg8302t1